MNKTRWYSTTAAVIFLLILCPLAPAQNQPITFSVMADIPYDSNEVLVLQQHIAEHNKYSPSEFMAHLGDFRGSATSNCVESDYSLVANILKGLAAPCFIVPGDNEYNDCSNPPQAWTYWVQYFMGFENNFCGAPAVERQSVRPENFAFIRSGVLFIGINLVGGSVHDWNEWNTRMQHDADWVSQQFQAKVSQVRAAVIFAQAGPNWKRDLFFNQFRQSAAAFAKPVLFMHGDGHTWIQDQPFPEPNILRVQVDDGGSTVLPVQVTVSLDTTLSMFSFERTPWSGSSQVFNMPPCVSAGLDQIITFPQSATLSASASDDGDPNPPANLTVTWSKVSGPGTVTFGNANALATTASFSAVGTYVLRLTANDGELQTSDDVTIMAGDGRPIVNAFSPASGSAGTEVTITGSYFAEVTGVTFNGTPAASFIIDNATQIRAVVPSGATTGKIAAINAIGMGLSQTDFITRYSLTVSVFGYGNVALNPPGGNYDNGTVVTLTATPSAGYQFSGWSGDLSGTTNPVALTLNANKTVTAIFTSISPNGQIAHEETQTGGSSDSPIVKTSTSLTAISGQLYLAAISTRPKVSVQSVSGLGLTWTLVKTQCSGRNNTGVEVWKALGTPSANDTVTATLAGVPTNAAIAVSRYSGVDGVSPIGNTISGNTNGPNGACSGGVDSNAYSLNLVTTMNGAMVYGAATMRSKTHIRGAGYTERVEFHQGAVNNTMTSIAIEDQTFPSPGTVVVDGSFNASVDWAVVALEMKPQLALTTNTVGSGTVSLSPPGGSYNAGTVVTLTATPASGYEFVGWSGDLNGSTNPAAITMNANKTVTATFNALPPPQYTLTVNKVGSGSVALNPPGGIYNANTMVTLTATPAAGFQFSGWSGDLSGVTNPAAITMNTNKTVTATFTPASPGVVHEETKTGGSSNSLTVTTSTSLTGVTGHLYLAAISMRPKTAVASVSGLGLNWTLVRSKCAGRNTTAIEVWMAQGEPSGNGTVTATFASTTSTAVIAVSRYSGAAETNPIGDLLAGNSNGKNSAGVCSGGVDNSLYSFNLTTSLNRAVVYGAVAIKGRFHTPGTDYTERAEIQQPHATNQSGLAVQDRTVASASTVAINGSFNDTVDWAVVALEIKPMIVTPFNLTVNTTGSGAVTVNPAGGVYNPGTVVTLTATPALGFQFSSWSGDLSSSSNPATMTMTGNKTVTAIFIPAGSIVHEETRVGSSSNSIIVQTAASLTGVSDHLYLAAVSTRPKVNVVSVSGLGLNWTLVKAKCAGRNTTAVEVWMAQGEPSSDEPVKATLASAPVNAVISVSRYAGAEVGNPIGEVIAGNTNGLNSAGACTGGADNSTYAFNLSTTVDEAIVYSAVALKGRLHTPGAGYTERAEVQQSGNNLVTAVAVQDMRVTVAGTVSVNGSFSGDVDWALVALEITPSSLGKRAGALAAGAPAATPSAYRLYPNYPNPFNAQSVIEYDLPQETAVRLVIYDLTGQVVRRLAEGLQPAGRHRVIWNGQNDAGAPAASGVYFYQLEIGAQKLAQKMVLLR
ncbi:MAG: T9SS type A sorting domain-containing protein [candidate division KSB1 bacterium]|nr:T9SS type A sorting domain-containing protein [candidate division KSB1 bacterium]MDZ7364305.1 T9SS type A sorting domain-containing protein [candidate division KSB1 bacterium]MDZ7405028.1 T9SS type A sorting domain-containing protein [candidate division KSB1 bacterium]